jgi:phosphohistidine phosphatase
MPRLLTTIRHAKSSWDNPRLDDQERPLNKRGLRAAPAVARYLQRLHHVPDALLSSPARRARDTAELMAEVWGLSPDVLHLDERLYFSGVDAIAEAIRETPDEVQSLAIFSHEPLLSEFCDRYCRLGQSKYPTSAACAMELDISSWSAFRERGRKLFFVIPKAIDPTL